MPGKWDRQTYLARIEDSRERKRFPAASPDATDIAEYEAGIRACAAFNAALVLGMTPELRELAGRHFRRVVCAERDPDAIALFSEWPDQAARRRERILQTDWLDLGERMQEPVDAILGDGVFGNLPDVDGHRRFLRLLHGLLRPQGRLVTRMAFIPRGFDPEHHKAEALIRRFREGRIDAAEFGFGMRLVGHFGSCYDPRSYMLDNARLFALCEKAHAEGALSRQEHEAIRRYYFGGSNCIVTQDVWEGLLAETGWAFRPLRSAGKEWREYYVVYDCLRE